MASESTGIQWTDATWSPVRGCSRVSAGCGDNSGGGCYAERQAIRQAGPGGAYEGLVRSTPGGPRWTGQVRLVPELLDWPLRRKKPLRIFVDSMSDLFHEKLSDGEIAQVLTVAKKAHWHTFQVLTKRADRLRDFGTKYPCLTQKLPNLWLGVSVENQEAADERIPLLLSTPAAVRFLSVEPLLGPVDLGRAKALPVFKFANKPIKIFSGRNLIGVDPTLAGSWQRHDGNMQPWIDWVIVGGESGPGARACDVAWIRSIVEQCRAAGVACFVKQLGGNAILDPRYDRSAPGWSRRLQDRKGGDMEEWPEDLKIREMPEATQRRNA